MIEGRLDAIRDACARHGVARLELFGSAASPTAFDPDRSDIDFIVTFTPDKDLGPWLGAYFELRDELQQLLGRPVDLVMQGALRDPSFVAEADKTRRLIYAVQNTEVA